MNKKNYITMVILLIMCLLFLIISVNKLGSTKLKLVEKENTILNLTAKIDSLETYIDSINTTREKYKIVEDIELGIIDIENKIKKISYGISDNDIGILAASIYKYSYFHNVDEDLLIAIAMVESSFNKYAINNAKTCHGIYQINVTVHPVNKNKIYDIEYNTMWGTMIIKDKMRQYNNLKSALNSYNGWVSNKNPYANDVLSYVKKIENI